MRGPFIRRIFSYGAVGVGSLFFMSAACIGASYWIPLKGSWTDELASDLAGRMSGFPVGLFGVHVEHWSQIRFKMLNVHAPNDTETLLASGAGQIRFEGLNIRKDRFQKIYLRLKDVAVMEDLYQRSPIFAWASKRAFKEPIFVKWLEAEVFERAGSVSAHLLKFESDELYFKGGVKMQGGRLTKAHLLIFLPNSKFDKIPKELRANMMKRYKEWRGIRLIFNNNTITAIGSMGPFFQAQWSKQ